MGKCSSLLTGILVKTIETYLYLVQSTRIQLVYIQSIEDLRLRMRELVSKC